MKSLYTMFLSAFTAVAVVSGSLIGLISYYESEAVLRGQFSDSISAGARTISNMIGARISSAARIVRDMSQRDFVIGADAAKIKAYAENAVELSDYFYNIYYFSAEGKLSVAAYSDKRDPGPYIGLDYNGFGADENMRGFHASVKKAVEQRAPAFSGFFYTSARKLLFTYIVPVVRDGKVNGLISAAIYASDDNFLNFINALKADPDRFICLFDSEKRLIASTDNPFTSIYGQLASMEAEKVSWRSLTGSAGSCLAVGFRDPATGIYTVAGMSAAAVTKALSELRGKIFSYALLCVALVVLASFLFAATMVRPVKSLIDGLKKIAGGAYSHRIDESAAGELGEAVAAFNKMSEKLYKTKIIENIWNEKWNE